MAENNTFDYSGALRGTSKDLKDLKADRYESEIDRIQVPPPDNKGRNPAQAAKHIITSALKATAKGVAAGLSAEIQNQFPKATATYNDAMGAYHDVRSMVDKFSKDIEPSMQSMKQTTARLLPRSKKYLPPQLQAKIDQVTKTLEAELKEAEDRRRRSSVTDDREATISTSINNLLLNQALQARNQGEENRVNTYVDRAIQLTSHKESLKAMSTMGSSLFYLESFHKHTYTEFLKKDLELKYRHLYVAQDTLSSVQLIAKIMETKLEEIKKNTGLPDYQKEHLVEGGIKRRFQRFGDRIAGALSDVKNRMVQNVLDKVEYGVKTAAFGGEMAAMALDSQDDMDKLSGTNLTERQRAAKYLLGMGGGLMGRALGNSLGKKALAKFNQFNRDVDGSFDQYKAKIVLGFDEFMRTNTGAGGFKGLLASLFKPNDRSFASIRGDIYTGSDKPVSFDIATRQAIVDVIPGFQAKQLKVLEDIAYGRDDSREEYVFNEKRQDFTRVSTYREDTFKHAFGDLDYREENTARAVGTMRGALKKKNGDISKFDTITAQLNRVVTNLGIHQRPLKPEYIEAEATGSQAPKEYLDVLFEGIEDSATQRSVISTLYSVLYDDGKLNTDVYNLLTSHIVNQMSKDAFIEALPKQVETFGKQRYFKDIFDDRGRLNTKNVGGVLSQRSDDFSKKISMYGDRTISELDEKMKGRQTIDNALGEGNASILKSIREGVADGVARVGKFFSGVGKPAQPGQKSMLDSFFFSSKKQMTTELNDKLDNVIRRGSISAKDLREYLLHGSDRAVKLMWDLGMKAGIDPIKLNAMLASYHNSTSQEEINRVTNDIVAFVDGKKEQLKQAATTGKTKVTSAATQVKTAYQNFDVKKVTERIDKIVADPRGSIKDLVKYAGEKNDYALDRMRDLAVRYGLDKQHVESVIQDIRSTPAGEATKQYAKKMGGAIERARKYANETGSKVNERYKLTDKWNAFSEKHNLSGRMKNFRETADRWKKSLTDTAKGAWSKLQHPLDTAQSLGMSVNDYIATLPDAAKKRYAELVVQGQLKYEKYKAAAMEKYTGVKGKVTKAYQDKITPHVNRAVAYAKAHGIDGEHAQALIDKIRNSTTVEQAKHYAAQLRELAGKGKARVAALVHKTVAPESTPAATEETVVPPPPDLPPEEKRSWIMAQLAYIRERGNEGMQSLRGGMSRMKKRIGKVFNRRNPNVPEWLHQYTMKDYMLDPFFTMQYSQKKWIKKLSKYMPRTAYQDMVAQGQLIAGNVGDGLHALGGMKDQMVMGAKLYGEQAMATAKKIKVPGFLKRMLDIYAHPIDTAKFVADETMDAIRDKWKSGKKFFEDRFGKKTPEESKDIDAKDKEKTGSSTDGRGTKIDRIIELLESIDERLVAGLVVSGGEGKPGFFAKARGLLFRGGSKAIDFYKSFLGNGMKYGASLGGSLLGFGGNALKALGPVIGGLLKGTGAAYGGIWKGLGAWLGGNKVKDGAAGSDIFVDVYRKDKLDIGNPLLSAVKQREGVTFADGKPVKNTSSIREPVIDPKNGQTLISYDDIKVGLVDVTGNTIYVEEEKGKTGLLSKFLGAGASLLKGLGKGGGAAGSFYFDMMKMVYHGAGKVAGHLWDKFTGKKGDDDPIVVELKAINEFLNKKMAKISEALDAIIEMKPKKVRGDADNDGDRDNSYEDMMSRSQNGYGGAAIGGGQNTKMSAAQAAMNAMANGGGVGGALKAFGANVATNVAGNWATGKLGQMGAAAAAKGGWLPYLKGAAVTGGSWALGKGGALLKGVRGLGGLARAGIGGLGTRAAALAASSGGAASVAGKLGTMGKFAGKALPVASLLATGKGLYDGFSMNDAQSDEYIDSLRNEGYVKSAFKTLIDPVRQGKNIAQAMKTAVETENLNMAASQQRLLTKKMDVTLRQKQMERLRKAGVSEEDLKKLDPKKSLTTDEYTKMVRDAQIKNPKPVDTVKTNKAVDSIKEPGTPASSVSTKKAEIPNQDVFTAPKKTEVKPEDTFDSVNTSIKTTGDKQVEQLAQLNQTINLLNKLIGRVADNTDGIKTLSTDIADATKPSQNNVVVAPQVNKQERAPTPSPQINITKERRGSYSSELIAMNSNW